jgi:hypothetical protein
LVSLGLQSDADPATADATLGTDAGTALEYFNGTAWVPYTGGTVAVSASGQLFVRTTVTQDKVFEAAETFNLRVTNTSGTAAYGTATILDDGSGNIYPDNTTGSINTAAVKDDDRPKLSATLDPATDTGPRDFITRNIKPEFTVTSSNLLAPGRTAQLVTPDGKVIGSAPISATEVTKGSINVPTPALDDGFYTYTARILDEAGRTLGEMPVSVTVVTDLDGVAPSVELAANGGDFNRDGIKDWEQNNVAQLPLSSLEAFLAGAKASPTSFGAIMVGTPSTGSPIGVRLDPGAQLRDVSVRALPAGVPMLAGYSAVTPMYQYTVTSEAESAVADVNPGRAGLQIRTVIDLPTGVKATAYLKFNSKTNTWTDVTNPASLDGSVDGAALLDLNGDGLVDRVVLTLTDGGIGDEDGVANGVVVDPGVLALSPPPVISGVREKSVPENQTAATTLNANEPVTWAISGGDDASLFTINAKGEITFKAAPNYERPLDKGADNTYVLEVKATNERGVISTVMVTVKVTDILEGLPIYFSDTVVTSDRVLSTVPSKASESSQIQFYATPRTDAATVALKAWFNPLTNDWFYGVEGAPPPYDCYVERPDVVLGRVLKPGSGTFTLHTYVNAQGNTQIVSEQAAGAMGLLTKGYTDLGSSYYFDSADGVLIVGTGLPTLPGGPG